MAYPSSSYSVPMGYGSPTVAPSLPPPPRYDVPASSASSYPSPYPYVDDRSLVRIPSHIPKPVSPTHAAAAPTTAWPSSWHSITKPDQPTHPPTLS